MDLGIRGKTALVTGGAQGIGSAITVELAKEGVSVVFTSRNDEAIKEQMDLLGPLAEVCTGIRSSLTDEGSIQKLVADVRKARGDIDILVNNAGHTLGVTDPHCSIADWRRVMRLNFEISVELTEAFLPGMKTRRWGRICNITSCAGLENSGPVTFSVAKAALTAYTRSMGRVLAIEEPGIVMTAVFPGVVITKGGHWEHVLATNPEHAEQYLKERAPLGRFGEIGEISPVVAFYCSQLASFSHGAIVPADAGQSKHYMYFNYLN